MEEIMEESRTKSEEPSGFAEEISGFAEELRTKSEESSEEDVIYELPENSECSENSESYDNDEKAENNENSDNDKNEDKAEKKLQKMIKEVGADTLLEIIRDNRNAAIRQIISEVEASQNRHLQTGVSATRKCNSIFDLASMA